ncbi:peptide chain release factor N(5)-glutamine methyltransferase [Hyphomonas sp.]|uniref:peptide chain release factor N(5)-glutamine methyltransferase n=1 Tax=Hyphomonas sp. TaxID=87 RepID=UPI003918E8C5
MSSGERFDAARARIGRALREAGVSSPGVNVNRMIEAATGLTAMEEIAGERQTLTAAEAAALEAMAARRIAREPLQHILGWTWFYGLKIRCDGRALIPREDSECVVEAALARFPVGAAGLVADLGTGTGCLLAAMLSHRPEARGIGVEASAEAAGLARENLDALGLAGRAEVVEGRWAHWAGWGEAELVISNPPYIAASVIEGLEPEVRTHDPLAALDGGADGLDAYREIIALGAAGMKPGAWLVLETGFDQREAVTELLSAHGYRELDAGQDLSGCDRWVAGRRPD